MANPGFASVGYIDLSYVPWISPKVGKRARSSMKLTNNKTQIVGEFWGTMSSSVEKFRFCSVENDVPKILQVLVDVVGMNLRERNSATVLQVQTDEKTWLTIDQHSALLFTRNQDWGWVKIEDLGGQRF